MQKCRFTPPSQDAGIIVLSMGEWDTHSSALGLQTQHYLILGAATKKPYKEIDSEKLQRDQTEILRK
jgi:Na+-translocating ferredoxin:NAD+ oxidoreductase RnfC subunit